MSIFGNQGQNAALFRNPEAELITTLGKTTGGTIRNVAEGLAEKRDEEKRRGGETAASNEGVAEPENVAYNQALDALYENEFSNDTARVAGVRQPKFGGRRNA